MTKCVNLRFRLRIDGTNNYFGRIGTDERGRNCLFCDDGNAYWIADSSEELQRYGKSDFEIIPRDPETYRDWQVGDIIWDSHGSGANGRIIFRGGEFVAADIDGMCICYTCKEMFNDGYRLALIDIERQIIEEKKKYEPQDGDVCFVKTAAGNCFIFIKRDHKSDEEIHSYACFDTNLWSLCSAKVSCVCDRQSIRELRPATEDEKQMLFDAMAKKGKRWNAEKKVVEDIPKPYEFKKGEPVLVRNHDYELWSLFAYHEQAGDKHIVKTCFQTILQSQCIPYNERTMHLLGTSEDYKEE